MKLIDFEYDGIRASTLGLVPCYFEGDDDVKPVNDIDMHLVHASRSDDFYSTYANYSEPIQFTFGIITNPCNQELDDPPIIAERITQIYRWLTRKQFKKFKPIFDDGSFSNVFCLCTFNIDPQTAFGNVVAFNITGITNAPYGYYEEQRVQSDPSQNFLTFIDSSDQEGYIYLDAEIKIKAAGDFTLVNSLEPDKQTIIKNCVSGEVITFDGKRKQISSNKSHPTLMNDFNYHFPRAVNHWNSRVNTFTANKSFEMSIRYFPICKGGLLL